MPIQKYPVGLLREEERQWVEQQAHRYKTFIAAGSRQGHRSQSDRARDSRLRRKIEKALDDLILLTKVWPTDQQNIVFTENRIRKFVSSLLIAQYEKETQADRKRREDRQYALAATFMEKGVIKCLEKVDAPYHDRIQKESIGLILTLKRAAYGQEDVESTFTLAD